MKRPTILSLGEVLWDLFPDGERFGGAPANFACHAAIQGADVTMLSAVGDDQHGRDGINILSAYGIDVSLMQVISETPTGTECCGPLPITDQGLDALRTDGTQVCTECGAGH